MFWKKKPKQPEKTPEEIEQEIAELDRLIGYLQEHPEIERTYEEIQKKFPSSCPL